MNNCPDNESLLEFCDGELSESMSSSVSNHLQQCPRCQGVVHDFNRSLAVAKTVWSSLEVPADSQPKIRLGHRRFTFMRYAAAASILLLVSISAVIWLHMRTDTRVEPDMAYIQTELDNAQASAKLLAAADILAQMPDMKHLARCGYQMVIQQYPATAAAEQAKNKMQCL